MFTLAVLRLTVNPIETLGPGVHVLYTYFCFSVNVAENSLAEHSF